MSQRLQIIVDEAELARLRLAADQGGMTLSEWSRQALRRAERTTAGGDVSRKLAVIRAASAKAVVPAVDIDQMLAEIEQGYDEPPSAR